MIDTAWPDIATRLSDLIFTRNSAPLFGYVCLTKDKTAIAMLTIYIKIERHDTTIEVVFIQDGLPEWS